MRKLDRYEQGGNYQSNDVEAENRALKHRLLKMNDDYNQLYYEMEQIKESGDRIRKDTIHILRKRV